MKSLLSEISTMFSAQRRKDIFLYLLFVVVAAIFWIMLTLNNDVQETYEVNLKITNMPDSITLINDFPEHVKVSVKDKGSSLIKYSLGTQATIDVDFNQYRDGSDVLRISATDLRNLLNKTFGNAGDIISIAPDSLVSHFTSAPGKYVPVIANIDAHANFKYVINGPIELSHDSVMIYSTRRILNSIKSVSTVRVEERDLKDTTTIDVALQHIDDVKCVPATIMATIPVEPLIMKSIELTIGSKNVPHGNNLITFPGKVELKYLVPASLYKLPQKFDVFVDYHDTDKRQKKLPVCLGDTDWKYGEVELKVDSVEYIIEN